MSWREEPYPNQPGLELVTAHPNRDQAKEVRVPSPELPQAYAVKRAADSPLGDSPTMFSRTTATSHGGGDKIFVPSKSHAVCGVPKKMFWTILAVLLTILAIGIGVGVGVGIGVSQRNTNQSGSTSSDR
jgi:hypothetical protein